jgi:hypothetical protein
MSFITLAGVVLGLACVAVLTWLFVARRRRAQQYHDALLLPTVVSCAFCRPGQACCLHPEV